MNWPIIEKEGLAVVWALTIYRPYILGNKVIIRSDHMPLKYIFTTSVASGRLQRWALAISDYDYEVEYKPGKENTNADALSRNPMPVDERQEIKFEDRLAHAMANRITMKNKNAHEKTQTKTQ